MTKSLGNCIVAQSGGPTAVINSSLCGVVTKALKSQEIGKVYGSLYGIKGVLKENFIDFSLEEEKELELLKYTPSEALGSCRHKLKDIKDNEEEYINIFKVFQKYNIKFFFYIGGNDSMDTVDKLSQYAKDKNYDIRIVGVPKTVDNDLVLTDHTPGFGSTAKYLATSVMEIGRDAHVYDSANVHIVEVMGRSAGFLAASCALAMEDNLAPDLIYLPERKFKLESFLSDIENKMKIKRNVTVVVSEGVELCLKDLMAKKACDNFGHVQLGGVCNFLKGEVKNSLGVKVKGIEMNILQRAAAHLQSKTDMEEAYLCGVKAVEYALNGSTAIMTSIIRECDNPYKSSIGAVQVSQVANKEKLVPDSFINSAGNFVTEECLKYLRPLVLGEVIYPTENGMPRYARLREKM